MSPLRGFLPLAILPCNRPLWRKAALCYSPIYLHTGGTLCGNWSNHFQGNTPGQTYPQCASLEAAESPLIRSPGNWRRFIEILKNSAGNLLARLGMKGRYTPGEKRRNNPTHLTYLPKTDVLQDLVGDEPAPCSSSASGWLAFFFAWVMEDF